MFHRNLPVFCGIANILCSRSLDIRKAHLQCRDDVLGLVEAQSGLSEVSNPVRIRNRNRCRLLWRAYDLRHDRSLAERSNYFVLVAMPDKHQRIALLGKLYGFHMYLGDQRAGRIDHAQSSLLAGFADLRGNSVPAINYPLPIGDLFHAVHEYRALALKFFDYKAVVDDLLAHVDRRPERLKGDPDNINGTDDPGAKTSRFQ